MKAIDPRSRRIANIYAAPFKTLMSNSAKDGEVLQLDTDRPLGTGFHLYRMAPAPRHRRIAISGMRNF